MNYNHLNTHYWNKKKKNIDLDIDVWGRETSYREKLQKRYLDKFIYTPHLNTLTRYWPNRKTPYLAIHQFNEGFSFELVDLIIRDTSKKEVVVLDPYCGLGTTIFTAAINKTEALGFDTLPMAKHITNTLLKYPLINIQKTTNQIKKILKNHKTLKPIDIPEKPIIKQSFPPKNLKTLKKIRRGIEKIEDQEIKQTILSLYISIINQSSHTDNTKETLKIDKTKTPKKPTNLLKKRLKTLKKSKNQTKPKKTNKYLQKNKCIQKNTTKPIKTNINPNLIITSPPYPDKYNYKQKYQLEHQLTWPNKKHKTKNQTNLNIKTRNHRDHPAIKEIKNSLIIETQKDKETIKTINQYFQQITRSLKNIYDKTQEKSEAIFVVENLIYKNETIPLDLIITDISKKHGYKPKNLKITWQNKKPNPKKYKKHQRRTIIHLTKNN